MEEQPTGFLLIDKPAGMTSHDVVDRLRKITGIKKIGHAGTLDPFATGLLILAIGRQATKRIDSFAKLDKRYEAEFVLGATTETLDPEREPIFDSSFTPPTDKNVTEALTSLTGDILQVPPMYAAIKVEGKKLYELARAGKTIEREPRPVTVYSLVQTMEGREEGGTYILPVEAHVSSGTYIRSLARDLGAALGTSGYVRSLRRTTIGPYAVQNAKPLDAIQREDWQNFLFDA